MRHAIISRAGVDFSRMAKPKEKVAIRVVRDGGAPGAGTLYLVGTPIGNMEDITLRALRVLKEVDLIACEDTRHSMQLLDHYGIEKTMVSYHEHNELTRAAELIVHLEQGDNIAMVSDAGMPGVSDPGYRLIALAVRHHIKVVPVPGASAFLSALVASGLPTDSFRFSGFLPSKQGARRTAWRRFAIRREPRFSTRLRTALLRRCRILWSCSARSAMWWLRARSPSCTRSFCVDLLKMC